MLIGILGDTHYPEAGPLWDEAYDAFREVDLILHAGDLHVTDVLDWLEERCGVPVLAVRGNGDDGGGGRTLCADDPRMKYAQTLDVDGLRIGMVHDATLPEWPPHRTLESIMQHEFGARVDVLVHGHTHMPGVEEMRGVLLVNPGSPTFPRNMARSLGTVAFLRVGDGTSHAWVHQLGEPALKPSSTSADMHVREAAPVDAHAIAAVDAACWRAAYSSLMPHAWLAATTLEERAARWARGLAEDPARGRKTIVAEWESSVVGYATIGPDEQSDAGLLFLMYLHPAWWRLGIGRLLIAEARTALRNLGYSRAVLWVLEDNVRARAFYEADGWMADDATRADDYGGVQLAAVRMSTTLGTAG